MHIGLLISILATRYTDTDIHMYWLWPELQTSQDQLDTDMTITMFMSKIENKI